MTSQLQSSVAHTLAFFICRSTRLKDQRKVLAEESWVVESALSFSRNPSGRKQQFAISLFFRSNHHLRSSRATSAASQHGILVPRTSRLSPLHNKPSCNSRRTKTEREVWAYAPPYKSVFGGAVPWNPVRGTRDVLQRTQEPHAYACFQASGQSLDPSGGFISTLTGLAILSFSLAFQASRLEHQSPRQLTRTFRGLLPPFRRGPSGQASIILGSCPRPGSRRWCRSERDKHCISSLLSGCVFLVCDIPRSSLPPIHFSCFAEIYRTSFLCHTRSGFPPYSFFGPLDPGPRTTAAAPWRITFKISSHSLPLPMDQICGIESILRSYSHT
ncbi:hypothetical protein K438DRAFT_490836 [Mycena galopus ATCC 62051]|nr:hypothetical protein K438DRAFT_490836 [Mycena galopus ATCC 62051]